MTDENKRRVLMRQPYTVDVHAAERILDRTERNLGWVADSLRRGQFATLETRGRRDGRARALLCDVLNDQYFVAIHVPSTRAVVTLLTLQQYENTYGPVPPVFLALSKQARLDNDPVVAAQNFLSKQELDAVEKDMSLAWNHPWRIIFRFSRASKTRKHITTMPAKSRQDILTGPEFESSVSSDRKMHELGFVELLDLAIVNPKFYEWITTSLKGAAGRYDALEQVLVQTTSPPNLTIDVTEKLIKAAAARPTI